MQQPPEAADRNPEGPSSLDLERHRGWSAGLLSVVLHATLFIAIGLLSAPGSPPQKFVERVVGIALVQRGPNNAVEYFSESSGNDGSDNDSLTAGQSRADASIPQVPSFESLDQDFAASLPTTKGAVPTVGGPAGIPDVAGLADTGPGRGRGQIGGQTRTQVFGASGNGSEFVYVFDRSSSMGGYGGRPLRAAKAELRRSLDDLVSVNQFQVVFYNENPSIFNPFRPNPPKMFFATEENRHLAQEFVQSITATGGTRHKEALEFALRMGPDVIFFLTDAAEPELTAAELADIRRRNRTETIINAIEFGAGPALGGDNFLVRLAKQNRGQHVYVDVTQLSVE